MGCILDKFTKSIEKITDIVYKLNGGVSLVDKEKLKASIHNEIKIIIQIIKSFKSKWVSDFVHDNINIIMPNQYYSFINHIFDERVEVLDLLSNSKINNGYDLLKLYESLMRVEDKKIFGQYYTPEYIIDKMLDDINLNDFINNQKSILDPACGVGAFLLKLIDKCVLQILDYENVKNYLNNFVYGNDINTNSILMTRLCLILHLKSYYPHKDIIEDFKGLLKNIKNVNTLFFNDDKSYDLIIGNPPYFKTKNNICFKEKYKLVINGQPNVYTLFFYWAMKQVKENGIVSFVIPQSIMSGKYFSKLRKFLGQFNLKYINLINESSRSKLFLGAEQAVLILSIENSTVKTATEVINSQFLGKHTCMLVQRQDDIFNESVIFFPKNYDELNLMNKLNMMPKFSKVFSPYKFGNGLFVWNQKKSQLTNMINLANPIIYANYITNGGFSFNPNLNDSINESGRKPYCLSKGNERFLFNHSTVLVKRTSSLKSFYRIKSCILDNAFLNKYEKYYVENHINMLYNGKEKNKLIDNNVIYFVNAFLKSNVVNYYVSKIVGNTQVSANDLNCLPFYASEINFAEISNVKFNTDSELQNYFYSKYNLTQKDINIIEGEKNDK